MKFRAHARFLFKSMDKKPKVIVGLDFPMGVFTRNDPNIFISYRYSIYLIEEKK